MKIILASASPRRSELLKQIGLEYEVLVSDAEEKVIDTEPGKVVEELAKQKADNVYQHYFQGTEKHSSEPLLIISADTVVACDGRILGKPKDANEARDMLRALQGRAHEVYTGVSFLYGKVSEDTMKCHTFHEVTRVHFYPMTEEEIEAYVATLDPMDKAGAYGIQGLCARHIKGIEGDYNNVVGLPVARLYQEMKHFV
ncbi:MAG: septum formation inhibitor Maf [Lachnospiraceae bacterium]|nr:septum formation inhibitor Maf [Lachnospiraceae bacterium]